MILQDRTDLIFDYQTSENGHPVTHPAESGAVNYGRRDGGLVVTQRAVHRRRATVYMPRRVREVNYRRSQNGLPVTHPAESGAVNYGRRDGGLVVTQPAVHRRSATVYMPRMVTEVNYRRSQNGLPVTHPAESGAVNSGRRDGGLVVTQPAVHRRRATVYMPRMVREVYYRRSQNGLPVTHPAEYSTSIRPALILFNDDTNGNHRRSENGLPVTHPVDK
ncbi:hypothetical protein BSL78_14832 [Apostichopus japonicus]|uniref:Uncharacterized protein n=1 Tax=Stichopus japonicus TaxID=307972 RepID=A0A2G8KJW3_STIJA|nr:hypothetical protein BSL78_14832 [Apostichopus japonicus]